VNPQYAPRPAWNDTAEGQPDFEQYVKFLNGQLKELVTNYGPLRILWFDGEGRHFTTHCYAAYETDDSSSGVASSS
jgi:alpha-L-fucosidase